MAITSILFCIFKGTFFYTVLKYTKEMAVKLIMLVLQSDWFVEILHMCFFFFDLTTNVPLKSHMKILY